MAIRLAKDAKPVDAFPGVVRKLLGSGEKLTLVTIEVEKDNVVPEHVHPHEQAGTVISGRISIRLGDQTSVLDEGAAYLIPGGLPHEVTALAPTALIEVFSPVREDFAHD